MSHNFYSGIFLTLGHRNSVINDLFRRSFYRVNNHDLSANEELREELIRMEIIDDSNLSILGRRKLNFDDSNNILPLKAIVFYWNKNQMLLRKVVSTNSIKVIAIVMDEPVDVNVLFQSLDEYWVSHVEVFINAKKVGSFFDDWVANAASFNRIVFYTADESRYEEPNIFYVKSPLLKQGEPNIKDTSYFICNSELYEESIFFNPAFFGKIYIDGSSFRIAGETNWKDSDNFESWRKGLKSEYPEIWKSPKEKTDICHNCEFHNVCIDNRLPKKRESDGLWYHTTECNYNPYIAKWKGEEGYRTLAECGVKSDETGFSIDHEHIAKINEELWGD